MRQQLNRIISDKKSIGMIIFMLVIPILDIVQIYYQDIIKIYCEIQKLILAETSYCNALNTYVRGLNTKEQIAAVKYGQEITDQAIKTNMDTVIAQGNAVMEGIVKQYLETAVPETKTDVKDTENTTDGTDNIEDAATEKSSKKA